MLRRIIWVVVVLVVVGAAAWALWPRPIEVETAAVERRNLEIAVEEEGMSRIREIFTISAPVAGELNRMTLHAGDPVVAGETVIASIRPAGPGLLDERSRRVAEAAIEAALAGVSLAEAQLVQAETQLNFSEIELKRATALAERGLIPESAFERSTLDISVARTNVETARATLQVRQRELDSAQAALIEGSGGKSTGDDACCVEVRAPVTGRVMRVVTESEQIVQPGTPLMELGDPTDVEIVVELLSRDAVRVEPGASATINGWGGPVLNAKVERIDPAAVTKVSALGIEEQRTAVVLSLLDPPEAWARLGHGYRVVARIVLWEGRDLVTVPMAAIFRQGDSWAVFAAADGKAGLRTVELGERNADYAEVRSGLSEGDAVIVHPGDTIADGTAITVLTPG
jgi:HlyD family secretion protein